MTALIPIVVNLVSHHPTTTMAENLSRLRALQRIARTSRQFNFASATATCTAPTTRTTSTPTILKSLPEHRPLLPLLLSHSVPKKLAGVCSERYEKYAKRLRSHTETKLVPYLSGGGGGAGGTSNHSPEIYSIFLEKYSHTLRDWAQSILNTALKSLRRDPVQLQGWDAIYAAPMWLPVCLMRLYRSQRH